MTLLQRISRNARNAILLCPRSCRLGSRRRGLNLILFVVVFFILTIYITETKPNRPPFLVDSVQLEKRAQIIESTSPLSSNKATEIDKITAKVIVTRAATAASKDTTTSKGDEATKKPKPVKNCTKHSPKLVGDMKSNPNITPSMEEVIKHVGPDVQMGGCFSPADCIALQKVAIIIPFKDREAHLKTLLFHLHPMLMRQRLHYCIYVAEQYDNGQFNKATVMNAAFEEVLKIEKYDCIIFHDVDMIPENDRNFYMCGKQPRHLSPAIDKFLYKPHYGTDFGGVTGITAEQYRKANGHSNRFWGWGGEDNDMEFRIRYRNMSIIPSSLKIGRYMMIPHLHPWKFSPNKFPWKLNNTRKARAVADGLSDLRYRLLDTIKHPMYTKLIIDIRRIKVTKLVLFVDGRSSLDIDLYPGPCRYEEFTGKYLDFVIELTDKKEAQDLDLWPLIDVPHKVAMKIKDNLIGPGGKKKRFSMLHDLQQAQDLCDKLAPECAGVQRENVQDNYSLRRGGIPRHLVISGPANAPRPPSVSPNEMSERAKRQAEERRYILPNKKAYMRYCPGEFSHFRPYRPAFFCPNEDRCPHNYHFEVHFEVLDRPTEYIYYRDEKHFESHLEKGENHFTFTWPDRKYPDFSDPNTPKKYSFRTPDFAIPNIPGSYAVESKIVDRYQQPYFQWNWWFEVTSGDLVLDAKTRDAYWKKKVAENTLKSRAQIHSAMMKKKAEQQKHNQAEFEKKMSNLKRDPRLPMPPEVQKVVEKMSEFYEKHESEGDPVAEFLNPNDPLFQDKVGEIEVLDHDDPPSPASTSSTTTTTTTTTTTKKLNRIPVIKSQFHLHPPEKKM